MSRPPQPAPEPLMTVAEVAAWLRVSPKTVYKWIRRGQVPCLQFRGCIRFDPAVLARWVSDGREGR